MSPKKAPLTYTEYKSLGYEKLHEELLRMLQARRRMVVWFNAAERSNLLPALMAMRDIVAQRGRREIDPDRPSWAGECTRLGITPEVVRQWKFQTASEQDIRHLIEEEQRIPRRRKPPDQTKRHLAALVQAIIDGDDKRAEQLAHRFQEMYPGLGG